MELGSLSLKAASRAHRWLSTRTSFSVSSRDQATPGTDTQARDRVYDLLVRECGAVEDESNRAQFAAFWKSNGTEYRFIGSLGFGGKFWRTNGSWYVNCYREDETPARLRAIELANIALATVHAEARS